jgi:TetR/AcrR family transcriptional regulator, transcriptional repressor for nem operon
MSGPRGETRRRILEIAQRHVMQRGYHAFSYQHISGELGVKNAAVHYHFRTKPALVQAVLEQYTRQFRAWSAALDGQEATVRLDAYIQLSRDFITAERVCCLGMMASEFNVLPDPVRRETERLQDELFAWISRVLEEGRTDGTMTFTGPAIDQAAQLACTLLGGQQLGRVRGLAGFEPVATQVKRGLGLAA